MARLEVIARALAEAFAAGDWRASELSDRGAQVLGSRPAWLVGLARRYARTPAPDLDALEARLRKSRSLQRAVGAAREANAPLVVRRWVLSEPRFGPGRWEVPALATTGEVATWLGVTVGQLLAFADLEGRARRARREGFRHYRYEWRAKPGGAPRLLEAPKPLLKALQRKLLHEVLDRVPPDAAAHGFVRERSVVSFARPHAGKACVLRLDLAQFFPSITGARVVAIFEALGYPRAVARILAGIATARAPVDVLAAAPKPDLASSVQPRFRALIGYASPHLPQGAPTSPAIANLAAHGLDVRLSAAAATASVTYTRYADDLAFSGDETFGRRALAWVELVLRIAAEEGFTLNARKTRLMRRGAQQRLAGVVVNAHPAVPRAERERLEAIVHRCATRGPSGENREGHPDFRAHLRGRIAWVEAVAPRHAKKLLALFERIPWA